MLRDFRALEPGAPLAFNRLRNDEGVIGPARFRSCGVAIYSHSLTVAR